MNGSVVKPTALLRLQFQIILLHLLCLPVFIFYFTHTFIIIRPFNAHFHITILSPDATEAVEAVETVE